MEKLTKKNYFMALCNYAADGAPFTFENAEGEIVEISPEEMKAFAEHEIETLTKRAEKSKTYKRKKDEVDPLLDVVEAALVEDFETIGDIAARVEYDGATVSKVAYRLNKLVALGKAEKQAIKVADEDGKKRTVQGYKILTTEE